MTEPARLQTLLPAVIAAVREAGQNLREECLRPGGPRGSGSHADIDDEIEHFLRERLLALLPACWRGEETGTQTAAAGYEAYCWLVDPHDGTAAFLRGYRGSSVSVALLRDGTPVLGVVYAPMSPDLGDDLIAWAEDCGPLTRNGVALTHRFATQREPGESDILFVSQDAPRRALENTDLCAPARFIALPSIAYRLARVAAGDGICAVSLAMPAAHDYAAGHALLRGAGGVLFDERARPVSYTRDGRSQVEHCFGGSYAACTLYARRPWRLVRETPLPAHAGVRATGSVKLATQRTPVAGLPALTHRRRAEREQLFARASGVLFGQVAGDSLGSLVEFRPPATIAQHYPQGVRDLADGGYWGTLAGQPTDDSEMAITLARSLIACSGYNAEFTARRYAGWRASQPFDIGTTTATALQAALLAARGTGQASTSLTPVADAARAAALRDSQANGALMRASPLGVFHAGDINRAAQSAREDAQLTHPNAICLEANAAFCAAIANGVAGGDRDSMLASARVVLRNDIAGARVAETLRAAEQGLLPVAHGEKQGWVLNALQIAFRQLLHVDAFEEALVQAVGLGGDTDTNAAITGALLGALHGSAAVPLRWKLPVQACRAIEGLAENPRPAEFWADDLVQLAEELLYAGPGG
jgi:ADP-ribosyl-[dinitrogen reductase] hydrolase